MKKPAFGGIDNPGPGRFRARFSHLGHPYQSTFTAWGDAEAWLAEKYAQIKSNRFEIARASEAMTFGAALDRYEREITKSKRGKKNEKSTLRVIRHFASDLLHRPMADLMPRDMVAYREKRLQSACVRWDKDGRVVQYGKKASTTTVRKELSLISSVFNTAVVEWNCDLLRNPVTPKVRPAAAPSIIRRLAKEEFDLLCAEATRYEHGTNGVVPIAGIIVFVLNTTLRLSELARMTWSNVNFVRKVISCGIGKNGRHRTIPLNPQALEILTRRKAIVDQIFEDDPDSKKKFDDRVWGCKSESIRTAWNRVVRRAGIKKLRFHDLRHEAISTLVEHAEELGLSLPELMSISGHSSVEAFLIYVHSLTPRLATKMQKQYGWSLPSNLPDKQAGCLTVNDRSSTQLAAS